MRRVSVVAALGLLGVFVPAALAGEGQGGGEVSLADILAVVVYVAVIGYLGWLGWRRSRTAEEYLIAGRDTHPVVMALSYGSTFISTAAIVGFAGFAAKVGLSILWLVFLNIFLGIFIAFVFFGSPTRRMGRALDAHTFPELLGRRYDSRFVQTFAGSVIFLFVPLYAAATLLGGAKFMEVQFSMTTQQAIFVMAIIVAFYVVFGGLRGVMYTDAFQGGLMFLGMLFLVFYGYREAGGIVEAHRKLAALASDIPAGAVRAGTVSFTTMPAMGSTLWWVVLSSLTFGVGIGVLAQPQLAVRFMTVKSRKELNRAAGIGGVFILVVTGGAYVVGALTNVYFHEKYGQLTSAHVGMVEDAIPLFVKDAMPGWFPVLFFLTLLSAAMSTLSGQFHVMGTALGRDVYERGVRRKTIADRWTRLVTQLGVAAGIVATVVVAEKYANVQGGIVAKATALFFALCASTFLPSYSLGLFWRRMNRAAAVSSMFAGFLFTAFWLLFVQADTSGAVGLLKAVAKPADPAGWTSSILPTHPWPVIDALVFALPLSFAVAVAVALATKPMPEAHLRECFGANGSRA